MIDLEIEEQIVAGEVPRVGFQAERPVVAANRIGLEDNEGVKQKFYGHSFIADHRGELVEAFGATDEGVLVHTFDLDLIASYRADWGFFRDRRPELYGLLLTADGRL